MLDSPEFSPAQLAPIVGVSESTLKRWVDSGHLRAQKTPGGHRRIAVADLMAFLRAQGRSVPSLAGLAMLAESEKGAAAEAVTAPGLGDLLLRGDMAVARSLLARQFQAGRQLADMLDDLVAPAMAEIGARWAAGAVDVYQEHLATLRAWSILLDLRRLLPAPKDGAPLALGASPEGDPYLLPTLMAEVTLAEMGWRTLNVGPNTPASSLMAALDEHRPRLVWLSVTSRSPAAEFLAGYPLLFERAQSRGVPVALGGQGVAALQDRLVASAFGTRLAHLKAFARAVAR